MQNSCVQFFVLEPNTGARLYEVYQHCVTTEHNYLKENCQGTGLSFAFSRKLGHAMACSFGTLSQRFRQEVLLQYSRTQMCMVHLIVSITGAHRPLAAAVALWPCRASGLFCKFWISRKTVALSLCWTACSCDLFGRGELQVVM